MNRDPSRFSWKQILAVLILAGVGCLAGCSAEDNSSDSVKVRGLKTSGTLTVLTRNAPTTYYFDSDEQPAGPEYEMVESFAAHLGVKTEYKQFETVNEILEALEQGQGDLAAAGITRTSAREQRFRFGPAYQEVVEQVVCRRKGTIAGNPDELAGLNITVSKGTSYEDSLRQLKGDHPALVWNADAELNTEQLLERVWLKEIDCTVADSSIVAINRRYFPELVVGFDLTEPRPLAWATHNENEELQKSMSAWFKAFQARGDLEAVMERFYGFITAFDYVDTKALQKAIRKKYPKYQPMFEEAAGRYDLDPVLLAAHSYQESHWNPRAKSPTGVRGIMMLTQPTAKSLGIKNRLDAYANIIGGARYYSRLLKRLDDSVAHPDRLWLALTAYNVGWGHLQDARKLARRLGKNPDEWADLKEVLPLLTQRKYYSTLKYGYARGHEPVRYVRRIRNYHDILARELEG